MANLTDLLNGEDKATIEAIAAAQHYTKDEIDAKPTGVKNLLLNPRKLINQRVSGGGGKIQVVESYMNVGGNHVMSFTGTALVTIYEFPALLADYATTIADASTATLANGEASGIVINPTAGYYIAVEFDTTDFNNTQLERGTVPTNLEIRHDELDLCLRYYQKYTSLIPYLTYNSDSVRQFRVPRTKVMRTIPVETGTSSSGTITLSGTIDNIGISVDGASVSSSVTVNNYTADAEIFNTTATCKEDRWFI